MSCADPIDAAVLADYWIGALAGPEEDAIEEHLLGCDECGNRLRGVMAMAEGIRRLAREGSLRMVVSDAFLQRAAEQGLRVREYAPPAGGSVECTVTPEDDLLIGRLAADMSGAKQIDLCFCDEAGAEIGRMKDVPVQPGTDSIAYQESIQFAKGAPNFKLIARMVALDEAGHERVLGEYTFNHTRSMPGPASW